MQPIGARLLVAPAPDDRESFLLVVAQALHRINLAWITSQLHAGRTPPSRLLLAAPPWTIRTIVYVPWHGTPRGRQRDYFDGPVAMHRGEATCVEIAAYDAAAMIAIEQRSATPIVMGAWPDLHCVIARGAGPGREILDTSSAPAAARSVGV